MNFSRLEIEEVPPEFLKESGNKTADTIQPGHKVYALRGGDWVGFVVGGLVGRHEDDEHFFVRSALLGPED